MKKIFLLLLAVFFIRFSYGQTYYISDGGSVSTCSGTLELGNVVAGQTYTFTICSNDAADGNSHISVTLSQYNITNGTLCVYDGNSTSAPQLGCNEWQASDVIAATDSNSTGCLTFEYTAQTGDTLVGDIQCNFMCEHSEVEIVNSNPAYVVEDSANYINICEGDTITFTVKGNYSNTTYSQSDATSTFHWDFGDGDTVSGINLTQVTHSFTGHRGYNVSVYLTDAKNCTSSNEASWRIRISRQPSFSGTTTDPSIICPASCQDANLTSVITEPLWTNEPHNAYADTTYLPDGTGESSTTSIFIDQFNPNQTITSINDLNGICANMEHSFLGDLDIKITCPNGTTVMLENQDNSISETYLGNPIDIYGDTLPGTGWDYCWTPNPDHDVMSIEAANYDTLPSGSYASYESLSNLVGCPMNGQWTITATDHHPHDDGYIFSWWINFDTSLYPKIWEYQNTVTSQTWTAPNSYGQISSDDGNGNAVGTYYCNHSHPTQTNEPFKITITDDYGCTYDTTLNVVVLSDTTSNCCYKPDLSITTTPQTLCGLTTTLNASIQTGYTGKWKMFSGPGTAIFSDADSTQTDVTVDTSGTYTFQYSYGSTDCDTLDTVQITFIENPVANAGGNYWPGLFGSNSEIKTDTACGYDYPLNAQPSIGTGTWHTTNPVHTWFLNPNSATTHNPNDTAHTDNLTYNTTPNYYDFIWMEDNGHGCTDQDTLRLFFAPKPTGNFTATTPWCLGYPSTIIAHTSQTPDDDYGLIHFNWELDSGIVDTTGGIPVTGQDEDTIFVHWDNGAASHIVSLFTINQYGCNSPTNYDTIVEQPKMNPDYDVQNATCGLPNGVITLYTDYTDTNRLTFTWDSTFTNRTDTIQQYLLGDKTFTILVHSESLSPDAPQGTMCTDTISIYLPDTGHTTALFDTSINDGIAPYTVSITNLSTNGQDYEWNVYDQDSTLIWSGQDEFPTFTINQEGYYHISLVSISSDNCLDTTEWGEFYVEASSKMDVPNVFTPNGDGINDYFQVAAKTLETFHGIITNRWGEKLYEWDNWKDESAGWDGKVGNSPASPGAYFYIIKATGKDNTKYDMQGTFYLLRAKK